ncbi:MAG: phospholipid carrier-dependent glycosyltransferase [Lentisphaeria bacterium]|nr:phospholipid carrier-dependent glycosyltransferase [Lentisphaeria bacterium]
MKKYYPFLVVLCFVLLYLGSIWQRPLFIPDETRYLEVPREMLATGNFVVPHLNGLPYFEKPVMGYWLNAAAMKMFGEVPGAVRFMGALGTLLSGALLYLLCRRAGDERLGRAAAMIFLLSGLVFAVGTYGVLDAQLCCFISLTMTMFYFGCTERTRWKQAGYLALAGVGAGLAFLTKGLLAFVLPAVAAVPFLIWQKEWKRIFTLPWIPLGAAVLVAAPWAVAVHRADPDFWHQFFWIEHVQRGTTGMGANDDRSQPFWFYIPVVIGGLLPWLLLAPGIWLGFRGKVREAFRNPLLRYAACMGGVWFVLFSAAGGKLATYVLPCFPAYAILIAWGLVHYAESGRLYREVDWVFRLILRCFIPALVLLFGIQVFNRWVPGKVPAGLLLYRPGENFYFPVFAVMVFLIWIAMAMEARRAGYKFTCFCVAIGFIALAYPAALPPHLVANITPVRFIAEESQKVLTPETLVLADDRMAVATAWALRRSDIGVYRKKGELAYGLDRPEGQGRFYAPEDLASLVREGNRPVLIVTGSEKRVREMPASPEKSYRRRGRLFIVHYRKTGEKTP